MATAKRGRKRLFVDPKLQGAFLVHTAVYWLIWIVTASAVLGCWLAVSDPSSAGRHPIDLFFAQFGPAAVVSAAMLPIVLFDLLRLSNKVAGPMYRLRNEMHKLAVGQQVRPIQFRTGDFGGDLAAEFNAVLRRFEEMDENLTAALAAAAATKESVELTAAGARPATPADAASDTAAEPPTVPVV